MVALSPLCDVVRGARGDCCSSSMVASAGGCGDDNLKSIGDENGSSFAADLDLRWNPGVGISCFTVNCRLVTVFPEWSK